MKVEADKTMWNLPVAANSHCNIALSLIIESDPFRTELILRVRLGFLFSIELKGKVLLPGIRRLRSIRHTAFRSRIELAN